MIGAGRGRRPSHRGLAVRMGQTLDRGRSDEEGHGHGSPEHGGLRRDVRHVDEDARPEPQAAPGLHVARERVLVPGAADVVAEGAGFEPGLRQALEVGDADELHAAESTA